MKSSRVIIIAVVILVILLIALFAYSYLAVSNSGTTGKNSPWLLGATYPIQVNGAIGIAGQQCVNGTMNIYCIGGQDVNTGPRDEVYSSSPVSSVSHNVSGWASVSRYPQNINGHACAVYSDRVYCVGGTYDGGGDDTASSYYSSLGNGTLGSWNSTTPYPVPVDTHYCVTSSNYIYCVGGNSESDGINQDSALSNSAWYAPLTSSGIGNWSHTLSYPTDLFLPSCFSSGGYIYCLGGVDQNNNVQSASYYAALTSSGIGPWTKTSSYPVPLIGQSCVVASGTIYCIGGQKNNQNSYTNGVYYAQLGSSGITAWKEGPSYPKSVETTCVLLSSFVYCIGGFDGSSAGETGAVYYATLSSIS